MRWMPRLRMVLAKRPWLYWAAIVLLAGVAAVAVSAALAEVRRARDAWGETRVAVVATGDIRPGEGLAGLVEERHIPIGLIPMDALEDAPASATATQRITVGEIVVAADISSRPGPAALLPRGWLAIAFPGAIAPFAVGDSVVILVDGHVAAPTALIVHVEADELTVGVPAAVAPAVALAVLQGTSVLALSGEP